MKHFVIVSSNREEPAFASKDWRESRKGKDFCQSCVTINRSHFPEPFDMVLREKPRRRISGDILMTRLKIYHKDFIDQIGEELKGSDTFFT